MILIISFTGPVRIFEKEVHTDRVDSIQWASSGLRFVSGSKDGTALIWKFEANDWHHLLLDMQKRLDEPTEEEAKLKLKVTMVAWTMNDQNVITAVSDFSLRVWDSSTGKLLHCLKEHKNDVFVLEKHPFCSNLLLSAGHDGQIIMWDLAQNKVIKSWLNTIQGQGYGAVYDVKWSPDGLMAAATDSHGHLLIFCIGENLLHKKLPTDLFFHTDYRPLVRDSNHWVLDEQTQMAPHLMPPPFLVDIDGNPYPPLMQRLVPGRARHKDAQLVPNLIVNEEGEREVQDEAQARSNIDAMIEELAARQNGGPSNNDHAYARSPSGQQQNRLAVRRSGDVEGVRQSGGNWQRGSDCSVWLKKDLVPLPSKTEELTIQKKSASMGKLELKEYYDECSKQPLKAKTVSPLLPKVKSKSPRKQPPSSRPRTQETAAANARSYRYVKDNIF
jgi:bromodomain and WD repeat domain containing protein 1/3